MVRYGAAGTGSTSGIPDAVGQADGPLVSFGGARTIFIQSWRFAMFKYSEINMNFEVTLYCAE
jgi:hypothetical protein